MGTERAKVLPEAKVIADRIRAEYARRQTRWADTATDDELEQRNLTETAADSAGIGGAWFLPLLSVAVPCWIARHANTDPDERIRRANELGHLIAHGPGIEAIADGGTRGRPRKPGNVAKTFNAIAEGVAIGAFGVEGISFAGCHWQVVGTQLRSTHTDWCDVHDLENLGLHAAHHRRGADGRTAAGCRRVSPDCRRCR